MGPSLRDMLGPRLLFSVKIRRVFLTIFNIIVSLVFCLLIADFASGFFHWAEDTWLPRGTIFDKFITEPNIEHHRSPGKMKFNSYWTTNAVTMTLAGIVTLICILCGVHAWQVYVTLAIASQSNQFHKWGHMREVPGWVAFLQKYGILQSVAHHGIHHKSPYAVRFCTTTEFLNPALDNLGFWRGLEWLVTRTGIKVQRTLPSRDGF